MGKGSNVVAAIAAATMLVLASGCAEDERVRFMPPDDSADTAVRYVKAAWTDWARDQLRPGVDGSALRRVDGILHPQDFGVPPSFGWDLTFRDDRAPRASDLTTTLRRACSFPTHGLDKTVTAHLVATDAPPRVPIELIATCGEPLRRLLPWLQATVGTGAPAGIRGLRVTSFDGSDRAHVAAYVDDSPAAAATAKRVMAAFCANPDQRGVALVVRAAGNPRDAANPDEPSRPVGPRSCEDLL